MAPTVNKDIKDSIFRIHSIISYLHMDTIPFSALDISKALSIPVHVIKEDLYEIHRNSYMGITLSPDEESDYFTDEVLDDILDRYAADDIIFITDCDKFWSDYSGGSYDEFPFVSMAGEMTEVSISVSDSDIYALSRISLEIDSGVNVARDLYIKQSFTAGNEKFTLLYEEIDRIIAEGLNLEFVYKTSSGKLKNIIIKPLALVRNSFDGVDYVVTIKRHELIHYRLDKIVSIKAIKSTNNIDDLSPLDDLPYMWGMENGHKFHAKVYFIDEGNVLYKVKRDLSMRKGILTEKDVPDNNGKLVHVLEYEDDVIGFHNFKSYLLSYGGSAVVMEPLTLRQSIIGSATARLEMYQ